MGDVALVCMLEAIGDVPHALHALQGVPMTPRSYFGEKTTPSAYVLAFTAGQQVYPAYELRKEKDGIKKKAASMYPRIHLYIHNSKKKKNPRYNARMALKDTMLHFLGLLPSKARRHEFVVQGRPGENTRIGTRVVNDRTEYVLVHGFTKRVILDCFTGQGSLVVYKNLLPLMEFAHAYGRSGHANKIPFQTLLDQHMGLDCTGFVGSYLMQKYSFINQMPTQSFYFQTAHHYKNHSVFRERLTDIRQDDVLVWEEGTSWHVALVDSVVCVSNDQKSLTVRISESYNGLETNKWKIQRDTMTRRRHRFIANKLEGKSSGWSGKRQLSCIATMSWLPMPG